MNTIPEDTTTPGAKGTLFRWGPAIIVFAALAAYLFFSRPAGALEGWSEDYYAARAQAQEAKRNLLLYFHADFCAPCTAMERSVLAQPEIKAALKNVFPVRLDVTRHAQVAEQFGVYGTPSFIITTPAGEIIAQSVGYRGVDEFLNFLRQATSNHPTNEPNDQDPKVDP
jgi:thiol:disulfide interchange protein